MARTGITKRTVDAATPGTTDRFIWDGNLPGFGLKVTPAGGKIYIYQYRLARPGAAERTAAKRYTIGKHGKLTPDEARREAKRLAALVEQGIDPRQQELAAFAAEDEAARLAAEQARAERELAFEKIANLWLDHYEHEKGRRPASVRQARLVVRNHLAPRLSGRTITNVGRSDLQAVIDAVPPQQRAMRRAVFAYASILFGWAHKRGDIAANPLASIIKPEAPKARKRVLTDDELAAVWHAASNANGPFAPFFKLLILTGQRRSEVAEMEWGELDRATATWTIPVERAKNDVAQIVHLVPEVIAELDNLSLSHQLRAKHPTPDAKAWPKSGHVLTTTGRTPISGITKAKIALDTAVAKANADVPLPHWRIHDLRRTLATGFQRLGIRFEVTEATLNHVSGAKGGVAGIYQQHDWKEEKRDALKLWAAFVAAIAAGRRPAQFLTDTGEVDPAAWLSHLRNGADGHTTATMTASSNVVPIGTAKPATQTG